jgi:serine/threonine-protein kinase ATR
MPSFVGASRHRTAVNGMVTSSQPPPSSLIATHLAPTVGSTIPHFDPEDFTLLLNESLGSDEDGQPNLGTDAILNHQLICVIIKAGLDTIDPRRDDPFRRDDQYHDQIQRCLEVIALAVERTPDVVFRSSEPDDLGPQAEKVPMYFWIIPKLLSLLLLDINESKPMSQNVWPLLGKILASEKQCSISFDHCLSISTYLQELIEGIFRRGFQVRSLIFPSRATLAF